jgi:hypothetical protein
MRILRLGGPDPLEGGGMSPDPPGVHDMTAYTLALFAHVTGALGLFVALGLEWNALAGLRSARTAEDARRSLGTFGTLRVLGPISLLTILASGLYLTATVGWQGWNAVGLLALVLIGVLGAGSNASRLPRLGRALAGREGTLPPGLISQLRDGILWSSMVARAAIALGIVFLMTTKPDAAGALVALAVAAGLGLALARLTSRPAAPASADARRLGRAS